jgi:hypothetical protein
MRMSCTHLHGSVAVISTPGIILGMMAMKVMGGEDGLVPEAF